MRGHALTQLVEVLETAGWRVFHVDGRGARDRDSFLAACARAMQFPSYFGGNWDAFEECVDDLSWAPAKGYVVVLEGCDAFRAHAPAEWSTAQTILAECAGRWRDQDVPFYVLGLLG